MFTSKFLYRIISLTVVFMLAFGSAQPVYAAPDNDNFANAMQIIGLPFNVDADNTGATFEADEPYPDCAWGYPLKTVWYSYKALANGKLTAKVSAGFQPLMALYAGETLNNLSQVGCTYGHAGGIINFEAQAGMTYYLQLSGQFDFDEGIISVSLEVTPPPNIYIWVDPYYPNIYDTVHFEVGISDPAGISPHWGDSYIWTLWDGSIYNESNFYHQFTNDGNYPISVTLTTYDGRTATDSMTVQVRTYDIAITRFSLPQVARANQTKEIKVEITNKRYSDDVLVTLYKGLPGGGEEWIGTLIMYVPARTNRPTIFTFSYTFTANDLAIGKATFRAEATTVPIDEHRDALPADNIAYRTVIVK